MQLTVKAPRGRECSLQVPVDELVSKLKQLVSQKLNVLVHQQRLLFKGKALADEKRLSDYNIGPNSKLNLVVNPLEKVLVDEGAARRLADSPPLPIWHVADASGVLEQLQKGYDRSLSGLTLDDIERLASRFLHPEVTEAMENGFSK
uniref:Ubiquitin-like protein 4A n=1 Tax=Jaculus jaculus TaxID=51337 RepID=A0A8C5K7Q0_JACJA